MTVAPTPAEVLAQALRAADLDFAGDLDVLRERFDALGRRGLGDVDPERWRHERGGVSVLEVESASPRAGADGDVVVFVHAGGYVAGSAAASFAFARDVADATGRTVVSVDYRLAPEHPFPAARDDVLAVVDGLLADGIAADRMALVGASAGGGIVVQALQQRRLDGGPMPAAAVLLSPFTDLDVAGTSIAVNAERDPSLTPEGLRSAAAHYAMPTSAPRPVARDLVGLPPLQIHVGSLEVLLSDATTIAAESALADVDVTVRTWPGMPHVFPGFASLLDEGAAALREVGAFVDATLGRSVKG